MRGLLDGVDEGILVYALRYVLGRHSYAPSDVSSALQTHWGELSHGTRTVIKRDIARFLEEESGKANNENEAFDTLDLNRWKWLLDWMNHEDEGFEKEDGLDAEEASERWFEAVSNDSMSMRNENEWRRGLGLLIRKLGYEIEESFRGEKEALSEEVRPENE